MSEKPNIILIVADDLDRYVYARMPRMARWFGEEGMSFDKFFTTTSVCVVSRCSMLTGKYAHNHGVEHNDGGAAEFRDSGADRSTVAVWLKEAGYATWFGGKYLNSSAAVYPESYSPPGWDQFIHYSSETRAIVNGRKVDFAPQNYTDWLSDRAVSFIQNRRDVPFFMEIATKDPHEPMDYPDRNARMFSNAELPEPPSFDEADLSDKPGWVREAGRIGQQEKADLTVEFRKRLRAMATTEDLVARVIASAPPNTYIIFASDNGFHAGLHRILMRKWTPYTEACRVPFAVRGPGISPGASQEIVANIDIPPTIAGLAGASVPDGVDGRDLSPLFRGEVSTTGRTRILLEGSPSGGKEYVAVREAGRQYVEWETGEKELYFDTDDPYQLESKHNDPAYAGEMAALKARLDDMKDCAGDSCRVAENAS